MDREILFRGKRVDGNGYDGEWIYGYGATGDQIIHLDIYAGFIGVKVGPTTVGQYTGLTDTKKHKAFVDDIVCYKNTHTVYGVIRFGEIPDTWGQSKHIGYYIEWQNDGANTWGDWWRSDLGYWLDDQHCEICGNIHDNHELIET